MTVDSFHNNFCSGIRVQFNWRRFFAENWPVELMAMYEKGQFGDIRLPWCLDTNNSFVSYDSPNASPVKLSDIGIWFEHLPSDRKMAIQKLKDEFGSGARSTKFEVPLYALPANHFLVLDGNHRLSALALSSLPFSVKMHVVKGPIDPTILPDLVHFAGNGTNDLGAEK
jgi:hypothetical protein